MAPASTRALPRRLNPAAFSRAATVSRPIFLPWAASSSTRRRNDFVVHVSGFIGSPCVCSSTSSSRAGTRPGSRSARAGRPAPGRRTRPSGSVSASSSARPRLTQPFETPAARATAAKPSWCLVGQDAVTHLRGSRRVGPLPAVDTRRSEEGGTLVGFGPFLVGESAPAEVVEHAEPHVDHPAQVGLGVRGGLLRQKAGEARDERQGGRGGRRTRRAEQRTAGHSL